MYCIWKGKGRVEDELQSFKEFALSNVLNDDQNAGNSNECNRKIY